MALSAYSLSKELPFKFRNPLSSQDKQKSMSQVSCFNCSTNTFTVPQTLWNLIIIPRSLFLIYDSFLHQTLSYP